MNGSELTIENLFLQPLQKPFSYNLQLGDNEACTAENVFEHIKKIFVNGLIYTTDNKHLENENGKTVLINKVTKQEIEKINKYMLSVGIEVIYKELDANDKDYYLRGLLYELEKKNYVKITATIDWKTQFIQTVSLNVDEKNYENLMSICKKHPEANYFLNLYKPENIKDYTIKYVKTEDPGILHVIYFKPADIRDHHYNHKYYDNLEKHVR